MKKLIAVLGCLLFASAFAGEPAKTAAATQPSPTNHRYLIERTFPAGVGVGLKPDLQVLDLTSAAESRALP